MIEMGWRLTAWFITGEAIAVFLTAVIGLRSGFYLTNQRDQVTGIKHHSIILWWALWTTLLAGPPAIVWVARLAQIGAWWLDEHRIYGPLVFLAAFMPTLLLWMLLHRQQRQSQPTVPEQPPAERAVVEERPAATAIHATVPPSEVWSAPLQPGEQWDRPDRTWMS